MLSEFINDDLPVQKNKKLVSTLKRNIGGKLWLSSTDSTQLQLSKKGCYTQATTPINAFVLTRKILVQLTQIKNCASLTKSNALC